jgi:hypothetical protein
MRMEPTLSRTMDSVRDALLAAEEVRGKPHRGAGVGGDDRHGVGA